MIGSLHSTIMLLVAPGANALEFGDLHKAFAVIHKISMMALSRFHRHPALSTRVWCTDDLLFAADTPAQGDSTPVTQGLLPLLLLYRT
jgi:hypothetical protein